MLCKYAFVLIPSVGFLLAYSLSTADTCLVWDMAFDSW